MDFERDQQRVRLLRELQALEFRAIDLNLFLDTHPDEERALRDYNQTHEQYHSLLERYQRRYGPLVNYGHAPSGLPWQWLEEPWPWEIEG